MKIEHGVDIGGTELGVNIRRTKLGSSIRGIRLAIGTKGIKWVENSPPPKMEFSTTTEEH
jgi:hypothetical protein